jgi:hypothetical protein
VVAAEWNVETAGATAVRKFRRADPVGVKPVALAMLRPADQVSVLVTALAPKWPFILNLTNG